MNQGEHAQDNHNHARQTYIMGPRTVDFIQHRVAFIKDDAVAVLGPEVGEVLDTTAVPHVAHLEGVRVRGCVIHQKEGVCDGRVADG